MDVTRVVLVDDDAMVRTGLRMVLSADSSIHVVGDAADGREAVDLVREVNADVVLMDLQMPVMDGVAATRELHARGRAPAVVVLTTFQLDTYIIEALHAGASGYLLKDTAPADIIRAVHVAAAGNSVFSATVTERLVSQIARQRDDPAAAESERRLASLTPRERQVADAVAAGNSNAAIATEMHVGEATVKTHVSRILAKTNAENRVQIALMIYQTRVK